MRRLLATYDSWSMEEGKFEQVGYVIAWEEDGKLYRVEHMGKTYDLDKLEAPDPIPLEHLTTPWTDAYLEAPKPLPPDTFVKSNAAIDYEPSHPTLLSENMRKEIELYTKLSRSPHPNICSFYGCIRDGSLRVSALALKHIPHELPYIWKDTKHSIPKLSILRGLKSGLDHLHSLGIVHNDINIHNLRFDESYRPIIIDFDAALYEGESMKGYGGTPGWFRKSELSLRENDLFGLGQIAKWLDGWEEDPSREIEPEEPCSWTEDYLAPKIIAFACTSRTYNSILSRSYYLGANLTMLNDNPLSNSLEVQAPLKNERMAFTPAHSHQEFVKAWSIAGRGLRSEEVDTVFFPLSSDVLLEDSEELRQLKMMIKTIPHNLRPRQMQSRLILFDKDSNFSTLRSLRNLEDVLNSLVPHYWMDDDLSTASGEQQPTSTLDDVFRNFVLVQPGGLFSWNRLRVRFWQPSDTSLMTWAFEEVPNLVAPDNIIEFVSKPPSRERGGVLGRLGSFARRALHVDDPALLTFVTAQAALTLYIVSTFAWVR